MAVNVLDVIQVVCKMTQAAQQLRNVYEFINAGAAAEDDGDVLSAVAGFMNDLYGMVDQFMSSGLTFDSIEVINKTQDYLLGDVDWPTLTAGTATGPTSPLQVAYLLRFPTNYRGSQGRKFIPGVTELGLDDDGELGASCQAALGTMGDAIVDGFTIGDANFVPGVDNPDKLRFAAFQSAIVNDVVGTIGRRKQGVGG